MKTNDFKHFENCGITTLNQNEWHWAKDRVTAGFVLELPKNYEYRYALFFHGDNEEKYLFGTDFQTAYCPEVGQKSAPGL